ncbi:MAG TPA: type II toxin-antitoxin system HigB family toxin [Terracidiphilus sp.]|nr:type II toxin-antitoxin system HigB family toxin [Terracidiphilus sp.]
MHVVTRKHLKEAEGNYPDAARELRAWYKIVSSARWRNLLEVRQVFRDADDVDGYVVFNIRQNRYRLVTIIHYSHERGGRLTEGHIYIRSFLTHRQYDNRANWDKGVKL